MPITPSAKKPKNSKTYKIAFIGNPNVGKSSLINRYSKKNKLSIGNWNGVTVEKQELLVKHEGKDYYFVDLPGVYDLNPKSIDERITVNNIVSGEYDLYVYVMDVNKIDRGLYLLQKIKELRLPVITLVNMVDTMPEMGKAINFKNIEKSFDCKFLKVSSKKMHNIESSLETIIESCSENNNKKQHFLYTQELNDLKIKIQEHLVKQGLAYAISFANPEEESRIIEFTTIKIMEKNAHFNLHIKMEDLDAKEINKMIQNFEMASGESLRDILHKKRRKFHKNVLSGLNHSFQNIKHMKRTLKLDSFFLNRWISLPLLLIIFFLSFIFVFNFSLPIKNWIDELINSFIAGGINHIPMPHWLSSLIISGILGGVGTILTFTPVIFMLFIWINVLRESGYMARISFIITRMFNSIGLSGKSIVPLVLGFGCNVTSIYATRTIKSPTQRKVTALISPYMMCSARLPIVSLIIVSFFASWSALVLISAYMLGIITAIVLGYILKLRYNKEYDDVYVEELPFYNFPNPKTVIHSSMINMIGFIKKASTVILIFSIFIWIITYFPYGDETVWATEHSILAYFSKGISYIFIPLGFGHIWQLVATIIPAIGAKEVTVGVLGIITNTQNDQAVYVNIATLMEHLGLAVINSFKGLVPIFWFTSFYQMEDLSNISTWFQSLSISGLNISLCGVSFMVFILLTIPCITTLAVMRKEFGNKFMWGSIGLSLLIPYFASLVIYWVGYLFLLI